MLPGMLNQTWMRGASIALAAAAALCAAYIALSGALIEAAILAALVIGALAMLLWQDKLPALFTLMFTAVAALNGCGYAFTLWGRPFWFDEVVHLVTPFVVVAAIAWILIRRDEAEPAHNKASYFTKVLVLGLMIGFAWEGFEYLAGIVGSRRDTASDLVMDGLGALAAAAFCLWAARQPNTRLNENAPGRSR